MNVSGVSQKRTALVKIKDQNGTVVAQKPVGANGAYTITNSDAVGVNRLKPGTTYTCELYWEEYVNGNFEYQNPLSIYATTQGTSYPDLPLGPINSIKVHKNDDETIYTITSLNIGKTVINTQPCCWATPCWKWLEK